METENTNRNSRVLQNVLIGDIKRFNGCFRDLLTTLKKKGYGDITMHKEVRASANGLHRMHLEFKPDCKSNIDEVLELLERLYSFAYDIWKFDPKPDDEERVNPTIWICDKVRFA